ncbi:MAG: hypothetical protein HOB32_00640 [Nitrospina sp.]|nr:hypothetical protein [Nitrospina sp.]
MTHSILTDLFKNRGVKLERTCQLNTRGKKLHENLDRGEKLVCFQTDLSE